MTGKKYLSAKAIFELLKEDLGPYWDKVKCPCEALLKEEPCELNCPEFGHPELNSASQEDNSNNPQNDETRL